MPGMEPVSKKRKRVITLESNSGSNTESGLETVSRADVPLSASTAVPPARKKFKITPAEIIKRARNKQNTLSAHFVSCRDEFGVDPNDGWSCTQLGVLQYWRDAIHQVFLFLCSIGDNSFGCYFCVTFICFEFIGCTSRPQKL